MQTLWIDADAERQPDRQRGECCDEQSANPVVASLVVTSPLLLIIGAAGYGTYYVVAQVGSHWGWVFAGVAFFAVVFGFCRDYYCSYCGCFNVVGVFANNHECGKCKILHIIDWD